MLKRVVLAGGSGFLGTSLADYLTEEGYDVVILTRSDSKIAENGVRYVQWDGATLGEWTSEVDGSFAVVNFTGKSVNCIYTKANKEEIISSRLNSVHVVSDAINQAENPPSALIQAGSLAIYGDTREECDENAPHGDGFSVEVCEKWEEAFFNQTFDETRQVLFRIGFVLGQNGGALEPLEKLTRLGLGGTVGSGKQYISWLHINDLNKLFHEAIEDERYNGVYNATGPNPVTNKTFMRELRQAMGKGWAPPAPTPFVWLGAYTVMRTEPNLALTGRNCVPRKLEEEGFQFQYTNLKETLKELV
ncbi:TIGR01777 family oxidoreductase [Alkalibacillus haloalkaliphilus]|uniref:TIGR01777 family oxidoreductase n=1 Tax=Alkalibacillus haloalkaliphilus TaxID=94136 RepID=UPI0029356183|nr:TIGR01777 family oxidoreductase [Alkalibacillus haloalkaliphilus]MDV2581981.1 TIGR01777 family oxidoreductase [Alkalibacillus haloalkaliphilus]